jgi:Ig domain of plant-specific actin-binding protein
MTTRAALFAGVALLLVGGAAHGAQRAAPANTSLPTISGSAVVGSTLTATSGSWSGSTPMNFSFRWQRCNSGGNNCKNINGANSQSYKLAKGDAGRRLRVSVTASNSDGSANATSGPTGVVSDGSPVNTAAPTIAGTAKQGQTLTATSGTWTGAGPISFSYQWRRCDTSGNDCRDTSNGQTRQLGGDDVGHTIRVEVRAQNQFGSTTATSGATGVVAPAGALPASSSLPVITGVAREGQVLTAAPGSWVNAPTAFAYTWRRCDANGNRCDGFATGQQVRLTAADVGHRIRVVVAGSNQFGTTKATSAPSAVVARAATAPSGAIKLPSGETSLPVSMIAPPQRLVISGVQFVPSRLVGRQAFVGRFRVTDTRGFVVRGALVYAVGLPYSWIRNAPETVTGTNGWVQITFFPTRFMPIRRAAVVFFVRARKPGDSLLAGVSSRRLVQVKIG